jgi:hypothetical protein
MAPLIDMMPELALANERSQPAYTRRLIFKLKMLKNMVLGGNRRSKLLTTLNFTDEKRITRAIPATSIFKLQQG